MVRVKISVTVEKALVEELRDEALALNRSLSRHVENILRRRHQQK